MPGTRRTGALWLLCCCLCGTAASRAAAQTQGFDVSIVLTQKAAAMLQSSGEGMVLMVDYYGWPTAQAKTHGDEIGQIGFGPSRTIVVAGRAGTYRVPAETFDPKRLAWLDGPVFVNLNIASARRSHPDNLLDCDFIDKPLAEVMAAPIVLRCGLITGDPHSTSAR